MLWRRFLVRSDSTLADLHFVLQIGFDWTDFHLHRFRIRKKDYAVRSALNAPSRSKTIAIDKMTFVAGGYVQPDSKQRSGCYGGGFQREGWSERSSAALSQPARRSS